MYFYKNVSFTNTMILKEGNFTSVQLSIISQVRMESGVLYPLFPNLVYNSMLNKPMSISIRSLR